jgi:NitT/TauT family transport system substrate-binding protein
MKKIGQKLLAVLLCIGLAGCQPKMQDSPLIVEEVKPEVVEKAALTIGVMGSVDIIPLVVAQEEGLFENQGVEVNVEIFSAAKDRDAALQAGALDGVICDEVAIAIYQNAGIDMKITGITDGSFALVSGKDSGVSTIADLAGKKIAISENTVIEYTVDKLLEENNMAVADVEKVVIPAMPTRLEMLNNGEVEAALLPNPFSDAALQAGGQLIGQVDSTGKYISVSAFLQSAIDEKADAIHAFYEAYDEAAEKLNTTDVSVYEPLIMDIVGYPESMAGQITLPLFRNNTLPPFEEIEEVLEWAKAKGLLEKDLTVQDIVSEVGL